LNPQELHKNKDMVLKQIDEMVKAGQIQKGQAEAVKAQMGLR
jgi:predicted SnoaL-like aldol condensation-catalyzing enzyme